jgi:hypothetical protein
MRIRSLMGVTAVAAAFVVALSVPAAASTILLPADFGAAQVQAFEPIGETFTAEDAFVKAALSFSVINPGFPVDPLRYDFYQGSGVGGSLLATTTFNLAPGFNGFFDFDLSAIPLVVGNVYSLVATDVGTSPYWAIGLSGTNYAFGNPIVGGAVQANGAGGAAEHALRVTPTATATPVPEPATLTLLGAGLLAQGVRRARQARQRRSRR